jgi:hypothetical protein
VGISTLRINNEHKQHLLNPAGKRMNNQNRLLDDAIKIGSEAEIDARDIKIDLERQSRQLEGTGNNVHRIHGNLSAGNKLIDAMMRHEMRNK